MRDLCIIFFFIVVKSFSQTPTINKFSTNIVSKDDYENLMFYKSKFLKDENNRYLYLKGFKRDGSEILVLNENLDLTDKYKIKGLGYNGTPKLLVNYKDIFFILYHSGKRVYVTTLNLKTKKINNFEFNTGIKTKSVFEYIPMNDSFIIAYYNKKQNDKISFWKYEFDSMKITEQHVSVGNTKSENEFYDSNKKILTLSNNSKNATNLTVIDLTNFKSKTFNYNFNNSINSNSLLKSKIYNKKLIQVIKEPDNLNIRIYPNYLNSRVFKDFKINEQNVNYYSRKSGFSKKNVSNVNDFLTKIKGAAKINLESFMVNNKLSLFIDMKAWQEVDGNFSGIGVYTPPPSIREISLGTIKTTFNVDQLYPYDGNTPNERLKKIINDVDGELIMDTHFEYNGRVYLTYYDMNSKSQIITEFFR
jgi:hypothetical protein